MNALPLLVVIITKSRVCGDAAFASTGVSAQRAELKSAPEGLSPADWKVLKQLVAEAKGLKGGRSVSALVDGVEACMIFVWRRRATEVTLTGTLRLRRPQLL